MLVAGSGEFNLVESASVADLERCFVKSSCVIRTLIRALCSVVVVFPEYPYI